MIFHEVFFFVFFETLWEDKSIPQRHKAHKGDVQPQDNFIL